MVFARGLNPASHQPGWNALMEEVLRITNVVPVRSAPPSTPPELARSFRLITFDWDGTAVESRSADARRVTSLIDRLLEAGARVAIVTGTNFTNVSRQL